MSKRLDPEPWEESPCDKQCTICSVGVYSSPGVVWRTVMAQWGPYRLEGVWARIRF